MSDQISFDEFRAEWLNEIKEGNPSTVELGNRFSRKLITQWLDLDEASDDIVYCDGSGDGGIDIACLHRGEVGEDGLEEGDIWYLVQSKYGSAFSGSGTLLREAQKVVDTLAGQRPHLSSLARDLLERLSAFRSRTSDRDKLVLVFATEEPLNDEEKRTMDDIRALGRNRLGTIFDVEAVSIATIYHRTLESSNTFVRTRVPIKAQLVSSDEGLLVGSVKLMDLYAFLKAYRTATGDLDQLYEKNVRRFLGTRGKVNKAIQVTLEAEPERFGLYNNGITIVVEDFKPLSDNSFELIEPYVVNGCQTTRTIWEVLFKRLESGGTGSDVTMNKWQTRLESGMAIIKVVKVGFQGEDLLTSITRYTNSQNAVREKDFLALTSDFRKWADQMAEQHGIFLEIQRGGWDSQKALQRQKPNIRQFSEAVNAFDLLKVYGAGWFGEAGLASGRNSPFLPNGTVFKRIINNTSDMPFGIDDLFAAYLLHSGTTKYQFGRGAKKDSRRQTKFLFYMTVVELLKYVMIDAQIERINSNITQALLGVLQNGNQANEALLNTAIDIIDEYLTPGAPDSAFKEPAYTSKYGGNLDAYLKWEQLGKSDESSPKFRGLLHVYQRTMRRGVGGQQSPYDLILNTIKR